MHDQPSNIQVIYTELNNIVTDKIICDLMVSICNWYRVEVSFADLRNCDIAAWVKVNITGPYKHIGNVWVFESQHDATLFRLRWT